MKLGVFVMIPQVNAKVLNGSHQHHEKAKMFVFKSQKWRQCLCVSTTARELFTTSLSLRDKLSMEVFKCSGTPMEEDSPCPARVLSTSQLVSSLRQCTGSPVSCCTRIFSSKTSVHAPSSTVLPWFIPLWLFSIPQTEVTIERAPVWRCSRHPSSCDVESSGNTTRRYAEVLPVFARSCHSLYRCRRDVLGIKYG